MPKPSPQVDVELQVFNGWDVVEDNNTKKSVMGRVGSRPPIRRRSASWLRGNEKTAVAGVTRAGTATAARCC